MINQRKIADRIIKGAKTGDREEYTKFFNKKLDEYGVDSPSELSDEKKKKFFEDVDEGWTSDKEKKKSSDMTAVSVDDIQASESDGFQRRVSTELKKASYDVQAGAAIGDDDDEDTAYELEAFLRRYIDGASDINDNEILFYEAETLMGDYVDVYITVNPSNQPGRAGKVKIGIYVTGEDGAPTYEDTILSFRSDESMNKVAKKIGNHVQKVLKRN